MRAGDWRGGGPLELFPLSRLMRFHGLLLTRDDSDIVDECIAHALTWCDALYVLDTGSSDDTPDRVKSWSARDSRVVLLPRKQPPVVMNSPLRGYLFNLVRDRFEQGDWFVQQDVDEFYHVSPRDFVRDWVRREETAVYQQNIEFRLTKQEVSRWLDGDTAIFDRRRPISAARRHYNMVSYAEPRMFRFRRSMQWGPVSAYPWNMGYVARERIPLRHYPHRDPLNLQLRLTLRNHLVGLTQEGWTHWKVKDWHDFLADETSTDVFEWPDGQQLPEVHARNHLRPFSVRCVQYLTHGLLLPVLDRMRPQFPSNLEPDVIPPEVNAAAVQAQTALRRGGLEGMRDNEAQQKHG